MAWRRMVHPTSESALAVRRFPFLFKQIDVDRISLRGQARAGSWESQGWLQSYLRDFQFLSGKRQRGWVASRHFWNNNNWLKSRICSWEGWPCRGWQEGRSCFLMEGNFVCQEFEPDKTVDNTLFMSTRHFVRCLSEFCNQSTSFLGLWNVWRMAHGTCNI